MGRKRLYSDEQSMERHRESVRRYRQLHPSAGMEAAYRWRQENPERWKALKRKSNHKRSVELRAKVIALLGGKCCYCGYDKDPRAFQIDHINGGGHQERKRYSSGTLFTKHVIEVDGRGYQLLCANCNQIKRFQNKEDFKYKSEPCVVGQGSLLLGG